jgi:hypothetical protein
MPAINIDLYTYTDADFCQAFKLLMDGTNYYDFTDKTLMMKIRRNPEDVEVFVSLVSSPDGVIAGGGGIDIYADDGGAILNTFVVIIPMSQLQGMAEGTYVHSMVIDHLNGCTEELWRGNVIHAIGPTR